MKIGFIGRGNMGGAILQGILQGGTPLADIYVADHNLETLRKSWVIPACRSAGAIRKWRHFVTLSFWRSSPMYCLLVLAEIGPVLAERKALPLLISIAAGKSFRFLWRISWQSPAR